MTEPIDLRELEAKLERGSHGGKQMAKLSSAESRWILERIRRDNWRACNPPGAGQTVTIERLHAELRRCDSNLVDAGGECLFCNAIQGEACRLPDPRKNPRTEAGPTVKHMKDGSFRWND